MKQRHILIAEDEPHIRLTLSLILRKSGYKVSTTRDGWTAMEIIEDLQKSPEPVDLLVTDIERVGMTVLDLLDDLEQSHISMPILVITGYGQEDIMIELMRRDSVTYIDKPFSPNELISRINKIFKHNGKSSFHNTVHGEHVN